VQGIYRVRTPQGELDERFVAAPGPMGWRYVGRRLPPGAGEDDDPVAMVDVVVDREWNLVRYRTSSDEGIEVVAVAGPAGMEVRIRAPQGEESQTVPGAAAVWSSSPATLLVAERRLALGPERALTAARLDPPRRIEPIEVRLEPAAGEKVRTQSGELMVTRVRVVAGDRQTFALLRADLPLRADGWFELIA
jgi:hypothetical protein